MSERTDEAELTITARLGQVVLGVARGGGGENNKESGGRETHGEKKRERREEEVDQQVNGNEGDCEWRTHRRGGGVYIRWRDRASANAQVSRASTRLGVHADALAASRGVRARPSDSHGSEGTVG